MLRVPSILSYVLKRTKKSLKEEVRTRADFELRGRKGYPKSREASNECVNDFTFAFRLFVESKSAMEVLCTGEGRKSMEEALRGKQDHVLIGAIKVLSQSFFKA